MAALVGRTEGVSERWDTGTQTPHGGQEWRDMTNFVEDFSVTTNCLGTPEKALEAAASALKDVSHYPSCDQEPACLSLAAFLQGDPEILKTDTVRLTEQVSDIRKRLILGNGASELIDLCIRLSDASSWSPGPTDVQYKEYERSAANYGIKLTGVRDAKLVCMVNPCNPTGDFLELESLKKYIEECQDSSTIIVDESMIFWIGPHWRSQSIVSQGSWTESLYRLRGIRVFVIHSWTKIWACPGLRVGSILAPTSDAATVLRKHQVPWSLSTPAIAFLTEVVKDQDYMDKTWQVTPQWNEDFRKALQAEKPDWDIKGEKWLSFLWIRTTGSASARFYVDACRANGVPVRWGAHGYQRPEYIRVAVRDPQQARLVLEAVKLPYPGAVDSSA
ncbi:class i ii superfamily protein [Cystoisospora suis]|uniref:Class i ii superfamily protein n=1 Tax=Cystoisospora suis TaxID=483139 RepID=A0A2C6L2R0_9APIC|nr:class i ii superfamily protein [Cystoisospora suis]